MQLVTVAGHVVTTATVGQNVGSIRHWVGTPGVMVSPQMGTTVESGQRVVWTGQFVCWTGHWVEAVCGQTVATLGHWVGDVT